MTPLGCFSVKFRALAGLFLIPYYLVRCLVSAPYHDLNCINVWYLTASVHLRTILPILTMLKVLRTFAELKNIQTYATICSYTLKSKNK